MFKRVIVWETVSTVSALGIRFWDSVSDTQITSGLQVRAYAATQPRRSIPATVTMSGIYTFRNLPGLQNYEYPNAHSDPIAPESQDFFIHVLDPAGNFMPLVFSVSLPLPARGIYPLNPSPEDDAPGVYLFNAPERPVRQGIAVLYAELRQDNGDNPAVNAVMEINYAGSTWYGLSDANGSIAVMFPYANFSLDTATLADESWSLTVQIRYRPQSLVFPLPLIKPATPTVTSLIAQPICDIWTATNGTTAVELDETLNFGVPLILKTGDSSTLGISPRS